MLRVDLSTVSLIHFKPVSLCHPGLVSYPIQFVLTVVSVSWFVCLSLLYMWYVLLLACVDFLSLLSEHYSVQFLLIFANVFSFLLVHVSLGPQLFSLTPPVGGVWLGPYFISVICTCAPWGRTAWMSLKDVHVHLTVLVYTLIKDLCYSAHQWVPFRDNAFGVF